MDKRPCHCRGFCDVAFAESVADGRNIRRRNNLERGLPTRAQPVCRGDIPFDNDLAGCIHDPAVGSKPAARWITLFFLTKTLLFLEEAPGS